MVMVHFNAFRIIFDLQIKSKNFKHILINNDSHESIELFQLIKKLTIKRFQKVLILKYFLINNKNTLKKQLKSLI